MTPLLEIKNLRKNYTAFSLKDISFTLERGFIMGFIGPNGAGKSTTIKLILNLIKKDGGEIKIFGKDNIKNEREVKNKIGFVLDESYYYEDVTLLEMKNIVAPFYKEWDDEVFHRHLKNFNLPAEKKIKELSKGMKMKYSLAIALSHHADLLIMDEPTSGLDPLVRSELLDILTELIQDENKGVLFSTHITSDLDKVADYVALIRDGEIVLNDSKDDILERHGLVKGPKEILKQLDSDNVIGVRENRYGFEALVRDKNRVLKRFKEGVMTEKPTLDDILIYYTGRNRHAELGI
ncbi:MAG: ABC transporter ATP-binding protein [Clostridia bacterium]|jgi:ABC-2 type transport system ATP-binding protein|nr:ABC transporter ATP-binding protein [Clostridiaceae bacterium]